MSQVRPTLEGAIPRGSTSLSCLLGSIIPISLIGAPDIINTFCYDFENVARADRRDVGFSLVPLLFLDIMLDLGVGSSQLIMTYGM